MAIHLFVYGHGAGDPGALGFGTNERDFNRIKLHSYILKWAKQLKNNTIEFYDVSGNKDLYQDTANGWGLYSINPKKYASVTEFHEDAASPQATGGHIIINYQFNPDNQDLALALPIRDIIGWWGSVKNTKGINKRDNLLNCNVAAQRGIPYRLAELAFITSNLDMTILNKELDQMAKRIVESVTGEKLGSSSGNSNSSSSKTHTVVKGDTLFSVAKKYNTTVDNLKLWNNLQNSTIYVGQVLQVERSTQITHVVVKGDTLWSISQKYKTTVAKIKKDNNLKSDLLVIGQKLKV